MKLFELTRWKTVDPILKMKALLVILASKPYVPLEWLYDVLLGPVGLDITSGNLERLFLRKGMVTEHSVARLHIKRTTLITYLVALINYDLTACRDQVAVAQVLLAIGLIEDNYNNWRTVNLLDIDGAPTAPK